MMDPTQPPSLKRQKIDGLPFSVVLNVDIESDRPIKSICTGFSLELKNNVANSIDVVRKLIAESHPENYGLELTEPQQYSSVETMFHVDLKEKNTTLNSAFNFAHDIARKNHEKLNFIEPTFDIILPEKIENPPPARNLAFQPEGLSIRKISSFYSAQSDEERYLKQHPEFSDNWALDGIGLDKALKDKLNQLQDIMTDRVIVAHPDTGFMNHYDILGNVNQDLSRNFYDPDKKNPDAPGISHDSTHGTATASIIVGEKYGVAPQEAHIVPIRTSDGVVYIFSWSALEKGLNHAIEINAHVISMSLGGPPILAGGIRRMIDRAIEKGIIVLAAAGNYTVRWVVFPASYEPVIAVAACGPDRKPWSHSAHGEKVDVTAPGFAVYRATVEDNQETFGPSSGTSYAVAHVAGLAALWMKYHGHKIELKLRQQCFKALLRDPNLCTPLEGGTKGMYGAGIVNAARLLNAEVVIPTEVPKVQIKSAILALPSEYEETFESVLDGLGKNPDPVKHVSELELGFRLMSDPKFQSVVDAYQAEKERQKVAAKTALSSALMSTEKAVPVPAKSLKDVMLASEDIPLGFKQALK